MMHGREKSDSAIVAVKPTNKAGRPLRSRWSQGRGPRGTRASKARAGHRAGKACPRRWSAYGKPQGKGRRRRFTALLHHVNVELLGEAFFELKEDAAPGVDGLTWRDYEADLERNLVDLHARVHRGAYRALPSRRRYIPKAGRTAAPARDRGAGGQDRPAGDGRGAERDLRGRLPRVLVRVPARAQPARCAGCARGRDHQHEGELDTGCRHPDVLRHGQPRVADPFRGASDRRPRIIRLIRKWLKAGVLEDGVVTASETGTPGKAR